MLGIGTLTRAPRTLAAFVLLAAALSATASASSGILVDFSGTEPLIEAQPIAADQLDRRLAQHRWVVIKRRYADRDGAWCQLRSRFHMDLDLGVSEAGQLQVVASSHGGAPIKRLTIQVDQAVPLPLRRSADSAVLAHVDGKTAARLVRAFKAGREAVLRVEPEYGATRTGKISLYGFSKAYARMQRCR